MGFVQSKLDCKNNNNDTLANIETEESVNSLHLPTYKEDENNLSLKIKVSISSSDVDNGKNEDEYINQLFKDLHHENNSNSKLVNHNKYQMAEEDEDDEDDLDNNKLQVRPTKKCPGIFILEEKLNKIFADTPDENQHDNFKNMFGGSKKGDKKAGKGSKEGKKYVKEETVSESEVLSGSGSGTEESTSSVSSVSSVSSTTKESISETSEKKKNNKKHLKKESGKKTELKGKKKLVESESISVNTSDINMISDY
jgi:hypothetical protein